MGESDEKSVKDKINSIIDRHRDTSLDGYLFERGENPIYGIY